MEKIFYISCTKKDIEDINDLLEHGWTVKMIVPAHGGEDEMGLGEAFIVLEKEFWK